MSASMAVFVSHSGQGCSLQTRLLILEDRRSDVIEAVAAMAARLPIGDPSDPATLIGPLISEAQRDRVHAIVTEATTAGARLVTGGRRTSLQARGWFYEPTVLDAPDPANPAARRELFGPVLTVLGYRDVDEAVAIANDSPLGLSGGVYTNDLTPGLSVAERIRSGTVQVNAGWASGYTPMGGYKQSGNCTSVDLRATRHPSRPSNGEGGGKGEEPQRGRHGVRSGWSGVGSRTARRSFVRSPTGGGRASRRIRCPCEPGAA